MVEIGTKLKGRYEIRREIKSGGMGAVYEAHDRLKDELIAVKQTFKSTGIHADLFFREASLLARLNHPALPKVHDFFTEGNDHFLTMDFVTGEDLLALLEKTGRPFATDQVIKWADALLDALEYMHTYKPQVVHRDIKPENIRLTPEMKVMLLDFGLAKNLATDLKTNSIVGGTRGYAPPEQFSSDEKVDGRADIYALGATLYHLLTATRPPHSTDRLTQLHARRTDPLRPANELNPQVSPQLAAIIAKAMELDREQRFDTASEMKSALLSERRETELRLQREAQLRADKEREQQEQARQLAEQQQREREAQLQAEREELQRKNAELQRQLAQQQQKKPDHSQPPPVAPPKQHPVAPAKSSRRLILAGGALTVLIGFSSLLLPKLRQIISPEAPLTLSPSPVPSATAQPGRISPSPTPTPTPKPAPDIVSASSPTPPVTKPTEKKVPRPVAGKSSSVSPAKKQDPDCIFTGNCK